MKRPEDAIQRACVEYLKLEENLGKLTYFAVPNGGNRNKITGAILKALGARAGVYDLVIILHGGLAVFAEVKPPNRYPSKEQKEFNERVTNLSCPTTIVRSVTDLQEFLRPLLDRSAA